MIDLNQQQQKQPFSRFKNSVRDARKKILSHGSDRKGYSLPSKSYPITAAKVSKLSWNVFFPKKRNTSAVRDESNWQNEVANEANQPKEWEKETSFGQLIDIILRKAGKAG